MPVTQQHYEAEADLTTLRDHPRNPRRGDDPSVATSLDKNGWYGAIIVQRSTGIILAGHTRRRVLTAAGHTRGPVLYVDCDDATALRILLADNRVAELATWDEAELIGLLREIDADDLAGVGFATDDMIALQYKLDALSVGTVNATAEWDQAAMPNYQNPDVAPAYTTSVHFKTIEDADAFFRSIERQKARSWWWPQPDGFVGSRGDAQAVATAST